MQSNYLFYDLETSGLNKAFDQIQQFAGKIVDKDFKEQESHFLEAKILPDVIPSPYAMITHRVSLADDTHRESEYKVVRSIHALANRPQTISLGYNTLGFDDELLRFAFHRNLLTPYTHQYANGCMRMDIFPMVPFFYLFSHDIIKWPSINGKISFKLEALAEENQWASGRAHHAMHDVDATISLAKHLREENQVMWEYLTGFFNKYTDQKRITSLNGITLDEKKHYVGLYVDAKMGAANHFMAPCLYLGTHKQYKNTTLWLRLDKPLPKEWDYDQLLSQGCIVKKKYAEPGFFIPCSDKYTIKLSQERRLLMQENIECIKNDTDAWKACAQAAIESEYTQHKNVDVDAILYQMGFRSEQDTRWIQRWHELSEEERLEQMHALPQSSLKQQVTRLLWRINPQMHDEVVQSSLRQSIQALGGDELPVDYLGRDKYGIRQAEKDIKSLGNETLDDEQKMLLAQLKGYVQKSKTILCHQD